MLLFDRLGGGNWAIWLALKANSLSRVRPRLLALHQKGEKLVNTAQPTPQWIAPSGLCAHVLGMPPIERRGRRFVNMLQLARVLKEMFKIVIKDSITVVLIFSPEEGQVLASAVKFVVSKIVAGPVVADYLRQFKKLAVEMAEAGVQFRKLVRC